MKWIPTFTHPSFGEVTYLTYYFSIYIYIYTYFPWTIVNRNDDDDDDGGGDCHLWLNSIEKNRNHFPPLSRISIPFDSNWENYYFSTLFTHRSGFSHTPPRIIHRSWGLSLLDNGHCYRHRCSGWCKGENLSPRNQLKCQQEWWHVRFSSSAQAAIIHINIRYGIGYSCTPRKAHTYVSFGVDSFRTAQQSVLSSFEEPNLSLLIWANKLGNIIKSDDNTVSTQWR